MRDEYLLNATTALDTFTKYWCMDEAETQKTHDLVFRCNECCFHTDDGICLLKHWKCENYPNYKGFGCMGDL